MVSITVIQRARDLSDSVLYRLCAWMLTIPKQLQWSEILVIVPNVTEDVRGGLGLNNHILAVRWMMEAGGEEDRCYPEGQGAVRLSESPT